MNEDGTIDHASGSPISGGTFVIVSTPSIPTKANDKGIYRGPLVFTFTGGSCTSPVASNVTGGGSIPPSAIYDKDDGLEVIRLGDSVEMVATGTPPGGGSVTCKGDVEVSDAGQDKAKGE